MAGETPKRVLVVGAGLSGLQAARTLVAHGHEVIVLEKGRAPGGRASSRHERSGRSFDHGAQFFTARSEWLTGEVESWHGQGVVAPWTPRRVAPPPHPDDTWWVGTPAMGSLAAHLARGLEVRCEATVTSVTRRDQTWVVQGEARGEADGPAQPFEHETEALVIAVPAAQCAALLGEASPLGRAASAYALDPCWAVMVALSGEPDASFDLLTSDEGPLAWAAREASKPGRTVQAGEDLWTLHASVAWSRQHLEDDPGAVASALTDALLDRLVALGRERAPVAHARAHRWRFARAASASRLGCLWDEGQALAVCGDWLEGPRIEGALESGVAAALRLARAAPAPTG